MNGRIPPQRTHGVVVSIRSDLDPQQVGAQVARSMRKARGVPTARPELPAVPYARHQLFREPVYEDGQPYSDDDTDDEDA